MGFPMRYFYTFGNSRKYHMYDVWKYHICFFSIYFPYIMTFLNPRLCKRQRAIKKRHQLPGKQFPAFLALEARATPFFKAISHTMT